MKNPFQNFSNEVKVQMVRETPAQEYKVRSSNDIAALFQEKISLMDREAFYLISLNIHNYIQGIHLVSLGTLTASLVHPREVFKAAILQNAASIMFVHNHPSSGNPAPSKTDIDITERLQEGADILGFEILDHIIFCADSHYSFREHNLLKKKSY